jgi:hypothetical protein
VTIVHGFKDDQKPCALLASLKLWQEFQCTPASESLRKEILDRLQDRGDYEGFSEWAEGERNAAEMQVIDFFEFKLIDMLII